MRQRTWLVFGGSFDPPHRAHVELPRRVADAIGAERLLYVPARVNPHKQASPPAAPEHRLAMLRLALGDDPRCEIRTLELDREGPSFMADTLAALADEAKTRSTPVQLVLLVGSDTALGLPRWHRPDAIATHAQLAVMLRPPHDESSFRTAYRQAWRDASTPASVEPRWVIDVGEDPASSTDARRGSTDGLDPSVRGYIDAHRLYREV